MQAHKDVHSLEQAFAVFNAHSAQLEQAYKALQKQVDVLSAQLERARDEKLRQLREKERVASRLERLLDTLPGAVLVLDARGRVSEHNPAAADLLAEPLLGRPWREIMTRAVAREHHGELELKCGRRVSVARRALVAEPGQIVLLTDVSETRRLQAVIERNQRLTEMGEMAARLAHQIRTPLSSAMLYGSHLRRGALAAEKRRRYADRTVARLQQIERMVGDMLVFARGGRATSQTFGADELLREAAEILEPQLGLGDSILIDGAGADIDIQGNREALLGALTNLASNALQAGDGSVTVRLAALRGDDGQTRFVVSDNGPGMNAATRKRVFEPFFTTRSGGTGLGLAVVQATARAHGGDVSVDSTPGRGTTFTVEVGHHESASGRPSDTTAPLALAG